MNKLEMATELKDIEEMKAIFEKQLKAIQSFYFQEGEIRITIKTDDFKEKGTEEAVKFDKGLIEKYLETEISKLTKRSKNIVIELADEQG